MLMTSILQRSGLHFMEEKLSLSPVLLTQLVGDRAGTRPGLICKPEPLPCLRQDAVGQGRPLTLPPSAPYLTSASGEQLLYDGALEFLFCKKQHRAIAGEDIH